MLLDLCCIRCEYVWKGHAEVTYTPGDPGRSCGPPEVCYPPEPAEVDVCTARVECPACGGKGGKYMQHIYALTEWATILEAEERKHARKD